MRKLLLSLFAAMTASFAMAQTNLLENASFEEWGDSVPTSWKSTSTASSATLNKSTDARTGTYAVEIVGATAGNKRMASKEMTLKAGTYTFSIYVKAAEGEAASRLGYVPVTDGKVGSYNYGKSFNGFTAPDTISSNWVQQSMTFELKEKATICLVVMNSKNIGKNIIADDASLTTADGGIDDNTDTPVVVTDDFVAALTDGQGNWTIEDKVLPEGLNHVWSHDSRFGMKASAYANSTRYVTESDLVSPAIILQEGSVLTFEHAQKYAAEDPATQLTLWIRGKENESWQYQLTIPTYPSGQDWNYVNSGNIDLSNYAGKTVHLRFRYTSTEEFAPTWEIKNVKVTHAKAAEGGDTTVVVSIANKPETAYTTTKAIELIDAGQDLETAVYVKGKIVQVGIMGKDSVMTELPGNTFGNATYFISDGTNKLEVYRGYYLNNEKFTAEDQIKVGDEVIVFGKLSKYKETYEIKQGSYIYSLNGKTATDTDSTATSIANKPETAYTASEAITIINNGKDLDTKVYVKGKISSITEISTKFGNATFEIADSASTLTIFRTKYLDGENFTAEDQLKVGDEIIVYGTLTLYKDTPELTNGQLCKVNDTIANGIYSIDDGNLKKNNAIYDLSGRRVQKAQKGIYIMNGRKFVK